LRFAAAVHGLVECNAIVPPAGWYLTTTSIPAVISPEPDGRIRLWYWTPRPDSVDVFVKARRR
jgi:hypothetical protein